VLEELGPAEAVLALAEDDVHLVADDPGVAGLLEHLDVEGG